MSDSSLLCARNVHKRFGDTEVLLPTLFLLTLPFADGSIDATALPGVDDSFAGAPACRW